MRTPSQLATPASNTAKIRPIAAVVVSSAAILLAFTAVALFALVRPSTARVMAQTSETAEAGQIRVTMDAQVGAWNKGDIETFMKSYDDSPETTFVGSSSVYKGYDQVLARYRKNYSSRALMGTLNFSDLDIRLLPSESGKTEYAVVTGRFHLERIEHKPAGQGAASKDDGIFSLVLHKTAGGWKIVLDHTA